MTGWQIWERAFFALVLWREARGESFACKVAVAASVLDRAKKPSWWGKSIIGCLSQKWQYSSVTDPNDVQLDTWPREGDHVFEECLDIVARVMSGDLKTIAEGADSYYDDSLQGDRIPKWAREHPERFVAKIGRINFYNMDGQIGVKGHAASNSTSLIATATATEPGQRKRV